MGFTIYVSVKMVVNNFSACCCFHYILASIVMSFETMTRQCLVEGFDTEEKTSLKNTQINNRVLHLDTG